MGTGPVAATGLCPGLASLVRSRRLELPQGFPHKHLKLARLPFRHDRIVKKAPYSR